MALYRKKPVVVEATQWFKNGDHPQDYAKAEDGMQTQNGTQVMVSFSGQYRKEHKWEGSVVRYFRHPDVGGETLCQYCKMQMHKHGWIDTPQGGHTVCPGDWIINEPTLADQYYPCKPDAFVASYEPVIMSDTERKEFVEGITRHMR